MTLRGSHLLTIDQLSLDDVEKIFTVAHRLEPVARSKVTCRVLEGAVLANIFFEASTRTRLSFGTAFARLGGDVRETVGFTFSSMAKGESLTDTSRAISGYVDACVVRHPDLGGVNEFASATYVPVINAGDGPGEHPSQALLDLYTINREYERLHKSLDGSHILFVGDLRYGRTVHSLIKLLTLYKGITITLLSPAQLALPPELIERALKAGIDVNTATTIEEIKAPADIIYATRIQKERLNGETTEGHSIDTHVNRAFVDRTGAVDAIVMHPLPRDSSVGANDLSTDLDDDPRLAIFRQTDNGIAVRMSIFTLILGVEDGIEHTFSEARWYRPNRIGPHDAGFYSLL